MRIIATILVVIYAFTGNAMANQPVLDSEQKDWKVFTLKQGSDTVCYITSSPKNQAGNFRRRGEPYVLVTYQGNDLAEVSVSSGYPYKKGSFVKVTIDDKTSEDMFTSSQTPAIAWAKDREADTTLIAHMKKGLTLKAKGYSRIGTYSEDTYSLSGFTKAHDRMKALCQ